MDDGPPSPARLFQALVAGVGLGGPLPWRESETLEWLETRDPPVVASPLMTDCQAVKNYMPNNDLDAVGGDPRRIGEIRTPKVIRPRMFDANIQFMYAWAFDDDDESSLRAQAICSYADRLYQFGRGSIWPGRGARCSTMKRSRHGYRVIRGLCTDHPTVAPAERWHVPGLDR